MNVIEMIEKEYMRGDIPGFKTGDTVRYMCALLKAKNREFKLLKEL